MRIGPPAGNALPEDEEQLRTLNRELQELEARKERLLKQIDETKREIIGTCLDIHNM